MLELKVLLFTLKKKKDIGARDAVQVVQHLPSKCKAPNSNPSTAKKKKKERKWRYYLKIYS
jgi:hypothetical protein